LIWAVLVLVLVLVVVLVGVVCKIVSLYLGTEKHPST